jgi:hypothetical protein
MNFQIGILGVFDGDFVVEDVLGLSLKGSGYQKRE